MRGLNARTLATAIATPVAVMSGAFLVQAMTLGRPGWFQTLAVRAIAKLDAYDSSHATITLNGAHMLAECSQHWGRHGHVETVTLSTGVRLLEVGDTLRPKGQLALDEFELASCPRALSGWLTTQLNRGGKIELRTTKTNGKPVYALRFPSAKLGLDIYISRRSALPLQLTLTGPGVQGTSALTLLGPLVNQPR